MKPERRHREAVARAWVGELGYFYDSLADWVATGNGYIALERMAALLAATEAQVSRSNLAIASSVADSSSPSGL